MKLPLTAALLILCVGLPLILVAEASDLNPAPDARYKADILLVVAHPDDEIEVAAYLAEQIERYQRRVAVLYATRGNSGGNAVGMEQAAALADVRESEARHSLASYGISNAWFLGGSDTPGADVLHSLEVWGHGNALDEVVRIVRLTRPEIIITWLPDYVVGENHEDHQASGVLATEAFDMAANTLAFPEQLEAPRNHGGINNYGEGLRPWQTKKIYYISDASHFEFFKENGPEYASNELSPSKKVPYSRVAANAWAFYQTQNDFTDAQLKEFTEMPVRLIFGKSLVAGTRSGDVFEGITPDPIAYVRPRGYQPPAPDLTLELGGPWAFYREFWPAHNLDQLKDLFPPEAQVGPQDLLWVPLLISNNTGSAQEVTLHGTLPPNWRETPDPGSYRVGPHESYPVQLSVRPSAGDANTWKTLTWQAESNGKKLGTATLRVNVVSNGLPQ